ncbi:MAG TPA: response regulator transcription factor [Candidatus Flavonifractor intestinipullorum]|uniref:Stage 0 sporulation protein A homolog n=1 Tax=Candidatus Flavonifractor intestinipullorum TaxID=2838587 RepID=A0A9D2M930_9FIRM|nr:response regulator transcription factor [Candidatus Flavonifractor intestinipullorum]
MTYRVFLAEDEAALRTQLITLLERNGYTCAAAESFGRVSDQALAWGAQLVLLDLNLPGCDGQLICRELRRRAPQLPIVVLTSRDSLLDELASMQMGADDFLTKPCHPQILLARLARLLQRAYPAQGLPSLRQGPLEVDLGRGCARSGGREVPLTRNETRLLQRLLEQPGEIVSRGALMDALWQSDAFVDDNTLTVNMTRLRKKLEELELPDCLHTRRGQGYQLCL